MKTKFLTIIALLLTWPAFAQPDAYFINTQRSKIIRVSLGHTLSISYRGYLGQKEYVKATVTDINDSMVTLGADPALFPAFMQKGMIDNPNYVYRKIYIRDILSFRRMKASRQLLKSTLILGTVVGSYYMFRELSSSNDLSSAQLFWISLGTGVASSFLINAFFPEAPKYRVSDGWRVVVSEDKPVLP